MADLLQWLQQKWFARLRRAGGFAANLDAGLALNSRISFNYLDYPFVHQKIFCQILKPGCFLGLGLYCFYTLDTAKRKKTLWPNYYVAKFDQKKDARFFHGLVLSRHLNFLSSTITLWNVFYNEIMEKTFLLFNPWITLLNWLQPSQISQRLTKYIWHWPRCKRFFFVWQYPRILGKITLKEEN